MNKSYQNKNDVSSSGYEDSEGETLASNEESHGSGDVLPSFLTSKGYKDLKIQKKINPPQIDSDEEEVHLLRITKSIDPKVLENTKFSLNKTSKVKTKSGTYYMRPLAEVPEPKLFMYSKGLKKISPVSVMQLEKVVESQDRDKDAIEESEIQSTPRDLINRHTVFGVKYLARIQLQEEIQQKMQEALQRFKQKKEIPKPKKKQIIDTEEYDDKSLLISQILEAKFKDKKLSKSENKKKNDHNKMENIRHTELDIKQDCLENLIHPECLALSGKKKKKNKIGGDISIEIKKEVLSESEMAVSSKNEKKKKKKRESNAVCITPEIFNQNEIPQELQEAHEKLDRKKKGLKQKNKESLGAKEYADKSLLISQILDAKFNDKKLGETENVNSNKKIKKKRDCSNSDNLNIDNISQIEPNLEQDCPENFVHSPCQTPPRKKKKKNKESGNISIEIKKELLSESETPQLSTIEKKKRKRDSDTVFITPEMIKQEADDFTLPPINKRKPSILSSTVIQDGTPDFKFDVSVIKSDMIKKKQKK